MDELPLEILDLIAEDEQTYRGILALPFFTRMITLSNRIDFMIKFGHWVKITKYKIEWFVNNKRHRLDGPAVEWTSGRREWFVNNKRHRLNGPAKEHVSYRSWFVDGKCHREDGPAIEFLNGDRWWYVDGRLHRLDGPAIELGRHQEWYINGKPLTEEEFLGRSELIS